MNGPHLTVRATRFFSSSSLSSVEEDDLDDETNTDGLDDGGGMENEEDEDDDLDDDDEPSEDELKTSMSVAAEMFATHLLEAERAVWPARVGTNPDQRSHLGTE